MGALRAVNGSTRPYGVKIWEIGNELYGGWQIGHATAEQNAERFVRFRGAMLLADPTILVIATGKGEEYTPDGLRRNADWNDAVLHAAAVTGGLPDYISVHPLVPLPGALRRYTYSEQYESAMAQPAFLDRVLIPDVANRIDAVRTAGRGTAIAITEWGIIIGGGGWRESPNHDTLAGAIFNALTLNAMLRHSDRVTLANMTALMHGGGIKKPAGVVIVDPQYWTQEIYAAARLRRPVETVVTGPGADVPSRGSLPAVTDVPDVDVFSAVAGDMNSLVVCAVNRTEARSRRMSLDVTGYAVADVTAKQLTAPDPRAGNSIAAPDAVAPNTVGVPAWSGRWSVTLPPHSLTVITLHARKGAEAADPWVGPATGQHRGTGSRGSRRGNHISRAG
jgi:alpha-N-arabinofuranosidase